MQDPWNFNEASGFLSLFSKLQERILVRLHNTNIIDIDTSNVFKIHDTITRTLSHMQSPVYQLGYYYAAAGVGRLNQHSKKNRW